MINWLKNYIPLFLIPRKFPNTNKFLRKSTDHMDISLYNDSRVCVLLRFYRVPNVPSYTNWQWSIISRFTQIMPVFCVSCSIQTRERLAVYFICKFRNGMGKEKKCFIGNESVTCEPWLDAIYTHIYRLARAIINVAIATRTSCLSVRSRYIHT